MIVNSVKQAKRPQDTTDLQHSLLLHKGYSESRYQTVVHQSHPPGELVLELVVCITVLSLNEPFLNSTSTCCSSWQGNHPPTTPPYSSNSCRTTSDKVLKNYLNVESERQWTFCSTLQLIWATLHFEHISYLCMIL